MSCCHNHTTDTKETLVFIMFIKYDSTLLGPHYTIHFETAAGELHLSLLLTCISVPLPPTWSLALLADSGEMICSHTDTLG